MVVCFVCVMVASRCAYFLAQLLYYGALLDTTDSYTTGLRFLMKPADLAVSARTRFLGCAYLRTPVRTPVRTYANMHNLRTC